MAELVDAPASGAGVCMDVEVRVLSWAPFIPNIAAHIAQRDNRTLGRDANIVRVLTLQSTAFDRIAEQVILCDPQIE